MAEEDEQWGVVEADELAAKTLERLIEARVHVIAVESPALSFARARYKVFSSFSFLFIYHHNPFSLFLSAPFVYSTIHMGNFLHKTSVLSGLGALGAMALRVSPIRVTVPLVSG